MEIKFSKKELNKFADKYQIKLIMLFGSFADGTNKIGSDYDVAVLGINKDIEQNDAYMIKELTKILKRDINLAVVNKANILLKFQIAKNSKLLFGKKTDYYNFKAKSVLEYMDNKRFFDLEFNYVKQQLKVL